MEEKIITFESYHDPMLAHIIRANLEDHGILCFIAVSLRLAEAVREANQAKLNLD